MERREIRKQKRKIKKFDPQLNENEQNVNPIDVKALPHEGLIPSISNGTVLPPFHQVLYLPITQAISSIPLPDLSFSSIYSHLILRKTASGKSINNHKGMDKALKHFEAGDISKIELSKVYRTSFNYKLKLN